MEKYLFFYIQLIYFLGQPLCTSLLSFPSEFSNNPTTTSASFSSAVIHIQCYNNIYLITLLIFTKNLKLINSTNFKSAGYKQSRNKNKV